MPGATEEDALAVCERMREAIQQFSWSEFDEALVVTGSFGVTTTRGCRFGRGGASHCGRAALPGQTRRQEPRPM